MNLHTALWNTARLIGLIIRQGALGAYRTIAPQVRPYIISLLIVAGSAFGLTLILIIAKVIWGFVWCGYVAAFLAATFTLALGLLWAPISIIIGLTLGETEDLKIREAGERYVRFVGILFFNELLASLYLIIIPFHNNLGLLPPLIILMAMFLLGSMIWGGWLSGKFMTQVAFYSFCVLSVSMFLPESRKAVTEKAESMDGKVASFIRDDESTPSAAALAGAGSGDLGGARTNTYVFDVVENRPTGWIYIPPGADFSWSYDGHGDIEFEFDNGKKIVVRNGEHKNLGILPSNNLRIKGSPGKIRVTIS